MPVNVISAGISTTIQDLGRPGYYHLGIPIGGAMDRLSLRAANLLVGKLFPAQGFLFQFRIHGSERVVREHPIQISDYFTGVLGRLPVVNQDRQTRTGG